MDRAGGEATRPTAQADAQSSPDPRRAGLDWQPPEDFDEYHLIRPLGRGAMGQVFLAHDTLLDRPVAVKFISTGVGSSGGFSASDEPDPAARQRFFVEARAIARLQHPNVVAIHRVGEVQRRPYLVSEYVRGQPLDRIERPVPWARALEVGIALARGLAAAHRQGVLHRDIKPANAVLSDGGEVKLLDFGLAKLLDRGRSNTHFSVARPTPEAPPSSRAVPGQAVDATLPMRGEPGAAIASPVEEMPGTAAPALTRVGAVMGSPLYMAPEIWRGEPASRAADVYSLGVLLYELCAGAAPLRGVTLGEMAEVVQTTPARPLTDAAPGVDARFADVVDRCLKRDPTARFASGDALRDALEQLTANAAATLIPEGNPYRGLQSFEAEHQALFFGRGEEVRALVDRLRSEAMVVVAGESGVGKSSLCRAGVLPAVAAGLLDGAGAGASSERPTSSWCIVRLVPGREPATALAAALATALALDERELLTAIRGEPAALARVLHRLPRAGRRVLLFIDQLEELLTLARPEEAAAVGEALAALAQRVPEVRLLATVRSDFLTRLVALPGLGPELARALHLLRPLTREGVREAIVGPARVKGYAFESSSLVDTLVASADRAEGGLPLLQFALAELWDARDEARRIIPASALPAIGGVEGALARHADGVLAGMLPAERATTRGLLARLVTAEGTRARRTEAELCGVASPSRPRSPSTTVDPVARAALETLVRGRLLVAREAEDSAETTYEIAHEALLSAWDTLRAWLAGDIEMRAARQRLERAAVEWERLGRAREALWSDRQLAEVAILDGRELGARETAFVRASRLAVRRRRALRIAGVLAVPLLAVVAWGGIRIQASRDLARRVGRHIGDAKVLLASARAREAVLLDERRRAFALFDAGERPAGDAAWERVLPLAAEVDTEYVRTSQALEAALSLDGSRGDVRALLGEVLYARAEGAERDHHNERQSELFQRMAALDMTGELRHRWEAPAHLTIETSPPAAAVSWQRYDDQTGHRSLSLPNRIGTTPLNDIQLPSASYLLNIEAPDRAALRYPVAARRGQTLHIVLMLPAKLPSGFVYVPPGSFLYGSAEEEVIRREFISAHPMHDVLTGGYLIGRAEVTFGEWIEFLNALPPDERSRRQPHINVNNARNVGALALTETSAGWRLTIRPTTKVFSVAAGEKLHYPERTLRADQDWLRFPITGITWDDATAYTMWLDRSGRVPGARLCDEHEWERAARGADDRLYPSGDRLAPDDANYDLTYDRHTVAFGPDEVGSHPASDSPFGVEDLAGNAWELTRSVDSRDGIVLRGGSWYQSASTSWSTNREPGEPELRTLVLGMRVCATFNP